MTIGFPSASIPLTHGLSGEPQIVQVFYYDGESLTLHNPVGNFYARVAAPGTLEEATADLKVAGSPEEDSDDPLVRQFVNAESEGPVRFHYPAASLAEDLGIRA